MPYSSWRLIWPSSLSRPEKNPLSRSQAAASRFDTLGSGVNLVGRKVHRQWLASGCCQQHVIATDDYGLARIYHGISAFENLPHQPHVGICALWAPVPIKQTQLVCVERGKSINLWMSSISTRDVQHAAMMSIR